MYFLTFKIKKNTLLKFLKIFVYKFIFVAMETEIHRQRYYYIIMPMHRHQSYHRSQPLFSMIILKKSEILRTFKLNLD